MQHKRINDLSLHSTKGQKKDMYGISASDQNSARSGCESRMAQNCSQNKEKLTNFHV